MKKKLVENFKKTIEAVSPENLFKDNITLKNNKLIIKNSEINLAKYKSIKVISTGKAGYQMFKALNNILKDKIVSGICIAQDKVNNTSDKIKIVYGSHPLPDKKSIKAGKSVIDYSRSNLQENDLVFFLISGGTSSLMTLPHKNIPLEEIKQTTDIVMNAGVNIKELNTIRKHLSAIKGGKLAEEIYPATLITLAISDVKDDDLEDIGSGPTIPDPTTYKDCTDIIRKYNLKDKLSKKIMKHFKKGIKNNVSETLKPNSPVFNKTRAFVIGNTYYALKKAKELFEKQGFKTLLLTSNDDGETKEIAKIYSSIIKEIKISKNPISPPVILLTGGELTVNVTGKGKGGRNQELILAMLIELQNFDHDFAILSGGTDGIDGPTDAAGAAIDRTIYKIVDKLNLLPQKYLSNNDSYNFFKKTNSLIFTGSTGTNVRDIRFFYIE